MKTNLLCSLKAMCLQGTYTLPRNHLTILLLLFVALALAGCEGMVAGSSGAASPWPAATTSSSAPPASQTGFASGLSGRWYHDGKPTSISVSGQTVTITNEVGQSSSGSMSGNEIVISGGPRGHVGPRGQRISWSNGTEWKR